MKTLPYLIAGTFAGLVMSAGMAQAGTPSSKVAIMQGALTGLGAAYCEADFSTTTCETNDTGWHTVMKSMIKVPTDKELAFDVAVQTALVTFTEAKSSGGAGGKNSAASAGRIQVRVAVVGDDNMVRFAKPCNQNISFATTLDGSVPFPTDGDPSCDDSPVPWDAAFDGGDVGGPFGVTYAARFQKLDVAYRDLYCTIDGGDCSVAVGLLIGSLNANAFNFVLPNTSAGVKTILVQARAVADAAVFGGEPGTASAEAFVGMGSTRVTTVRAVKSSTFDAFETFDLE